MGLRLQTKTACGASGAGAVVDISAMTMQACTQSSSLGGSGDRNEKT